MSEPMPVKGTQEICPPHVFIFKRKLSTHRQCANCNLSEEYVNQVVGQPVQGKCLEVWKHNGTRLHARRGDCFEWTPLTAAPTAPVLRCMDKLEEDGSTFRCTLAQGHEGRPHECGDWEWWSPIGIDLGSKAAAPTGSTEPQKCIGTEFEGCGVMQFSTPEDAQKAKRLCEELQEYWREKLREKVGSTEEAKGEKPEELDADNNSRIAFQLLASAFAQIADEDAREILGRLSNDALCQLREPNSTATQQEWRIWMSPKNARNRTWWRDYEYRTDSVEAQQDAARTNSKGETMKTLFPFQQRVVAEKQELDYKRISLGAFIEGPTFQLLPADERNRLEQQAIAMTTYSTILGERIEKFHE